jgi:hypothetical protein
VGGGIKTIDRDRLEARIAAPDSSIATFRVSNLHDPGNRREITDWIKVGVLIDLTEIGIVVLDCLPEQFKASLCKLTSLRLVRAGDRF